MKKSIFAVAWMVIAISIWAADSSIRNIGKAFPEKIGSLILMDTVDYEKKAPGLGVGLSYRAPGINADIYAYDFRIKDIPDGVNSETVKKHFEEVAGDIYQFEKMKKYKNVKALGEMEKKNMSGIDFLCRKFTYSSEDKDKESFIYITGYRGNFLKIRITHAAKDEKLAEEAANFASKVFEILGKTEVEPAKNE